MNEEKVSVIIPIYNVEKYLRKCIDSIQLQTYSYLEIILVNDGSTDHSIEICKEYASNDKRIVIIDKPNGGLSSARNAGLEVATGQYCYFLDSDDYVEPILIEVSVNLMRTLDAQLVAFSFSKVLEDKTLLFTFHNRKASYVIKNEKERFDFYAKVLYLYEIGFEVWNKMYRLDIIKKFNLRFENNEEVFAEDICFNSYYCMHVNKIVTTDKVLHNYLERSESIMSQNLFKNKISNFLDLLGRVRKYIKKTANDVYFEEHFYLLFCALMHNQYTKYKPWCLPEVIRKEQSGAFGEFYKHYIKKSYENRKYLSQYYKGSCDKKGNDISNIFLQEIYISKYLELAGSYYLTLKCLRKLIRGCKGRGFQIYYTIRTSFLWHLFMKFPLQNKIVFNNFSGLGYADNQKYIAEILRKENPEIMLVWLVKTIGIEDIPKDIKQVKIHSYHMIYELATARFWINNSRINYLAKKRKNQYYIQTWHGSYGGKKSEKEVEDRLDKSYIKMAKLDSKLADLFLSNARLMTNHYHKTYWYQGYVLESGFPRNDILIKRDRVSINRIKEKLDISRGTKVLLYAPTFRDNRRTDVYHLELEEIITALNEKFGGTFRVLYRMHPNLFFEGSRYTIPDMVQDVTSYSDMQELLLISDVLITDYSSSYLDFILMKRPVFFYMPDYIEFMKERAFHFDLTKLFIPCAFSNEELISNIMNFQRKTYEEGWESFMDWYKFLEDGDAARRVKDWIMKRMK